LRPRVTIAIVTYDSAVFLPELFASLRAHTDLERNAIVVVDNGSRDDSLKLLEAEAARTQNVTLRPQYENTGFARGNNIAFDESRRLGSEYVLCLNPDTVVTQGWLDRLVEVADARPEIGAAQPLLLLHAEQDRINSAGNVVHFCGFGYCESYRKTIEEAGVGDEVVPVGYATGAALLLRMTALAEVGDFDERLFLYHEDLELQLRLRRAGWESVLVPTARVFHKYNPRFSANKFYFMERNRLMVLLKNWPLPFLVASLPALAGVEAAVLVMAARDHWLKEKLVGYGEVLRELPALLRERGAVQALGHTGSTEVEHFTGKIAFEGFDHPIVTRFANPLLERYLAFVRRTLSG
jgi:GT2 family glycosyltransferase